MSGIIPQAHHMRGNECYSRPLYRRGRRATAVKVFTIADESVHLLVFGVPAINLQNELSNIVLPIGEATVTKVSDYPDLEEFTELFHLRFSLISSARAAKKRLDGLEFFGGVLHVCYAPELETLEETRSKIVQRSKLVHAMSKHSGKKKLRGFNEGNASGETI